MEPIVCRGGAASCLLDAAGHGDLLVVGSRGRGGFTRLTLGSTSTQCATHAEVPTAVIPLGAPIGPVRRLVVGIDGSPNSIAAARWAIDFADAGTIVECVMAWDVTPLITSAESYVLPEATDLVRRRFGETMKNSDGRRIAATSRSCNASKKASLAVCSVTPHEQGDLFVMGARGQGAISSMLLGSVSSWLLHHVERPIVVVPDPAPTA